jgi:hypothetical protein
MVPPEHLVSSTADRPEQATHVRERMSARSYDEVLVERGKERIAKGDAISEIALRVHTEPLDWEPYVTKLDRAPYPNVALVLHLVPVPGTDSSWFGVWGFMGDVLGSRELTFQGIFYPGRLPARDVEQIRSAAAALGIPSRYVEPWKAFLKRLFRWSYRPGHRVPLVAWGLPGHLGLLAADWVAAPDGGIDLIVWTQPDRRKKVKEKRRRKRLRNGEIENPRRPRIHLDEIGRGRARIRFTDRWAPDERDRVPEGETEPDDRYQFPGRFVDLASLSYGVCGTEYDSLDHAADSFGISVASQEGGTEPGIGPLMATAFHRLDIQGRLYSELLIEHESRGVPIAPHRVYSPAAYGWAMERAAGIDPAIVRWPDFPRGVLAAWMGAFHGGENRIGLLVPSTVPLPVTTGDFTGGYVAIGARTGAWRFHVASRVAVRNIDPEATRRYVERLVVKMRRWMERPTGRSPLPRRDMERLAFTLVNVIPKGGGLPHKRRNAAGTAWRMHVGPLTHTEPVPFVLFDVLRAACETGKLPEIRSGHRLVPIGQTEGLQSITLPDGTVVPPGEDLALALGTFRLRLSARHDLDDAGRERLVGWAKLVGNAMVSGLPSQVNRRRLHGKRAKLRVWDHAGANRVVPTDVVEEPGAWYFPPLAAAVTAGQRFLTFLTRGLVEVNAGHVPYIATDSLGIISTGDGHDLPCQGGPDAVVDPATGWKVPGYHALSFAEVEWIRHAVEVFSPYPPELRSHRTRWIPRPPTIGRFGLPDKDTRPYPVRQTLPRLLKLESENFDGGGSFRHQAHMLARSPMRAYLYMVHSGGAHVEVGPPPRVVDDPSIVDLEVLKASEQSLGQLLPPPGLGEEWIPRVAEHELKLRLGLRDPDPEGWDEPVVVLLPITSIGESKDRRGRDRRPWSMVAILRPHPVFGPRQSDGKPAIPTTIWHDGFDWREVEWIDFVTGEPIERVHTGTRSFGEQARVLTYAEVARKHFSRVPERVLGTDGKPVSHETLGPLAPAPTEVSIVRLIGREMNLLDRAGITTNPDYSDYTDDRQRRRLALEVLRAAGVRRVSVATLLPVRTVRRFLSLGNTSRERWTRYMNAATEIATGELVSWDQALPTGDEARWRLCATDFAAQRVCSCGTRLVGRQRRWCSKCRRLSGAWRGRIRQKVV